jgi:hypothetical protein
MSKEERPIFDPAKIPYAIPMEIFPNSLSKKEIGPREGASCRGQKLMGVFLTGKIDFNGTSIYYAGVETDSTLDFKEMRARILRKANIAIRIVGIWIVGFILAFLFVNALSHQLKNSVFIQRWIEELGYYRGTGTYYHRSAGFARTDYGKFGISGIPDIQAIPGRKIVLFGDSYTEAHQVDDDEKVAQLLTGLFDGKVTAVGFGYSNQNVVDYVYQIPRVEQLITGIEYYIIIIPSVFDLLPKEPSDFTYAQYLDEPSLRFLPSKKNPVLLASMRRFLRKYRLSSVWHILLNLKSSLDELKTKFTVSAPPQKPNTSTNLTESYRFILRRLQDATDVPVMIAYIPEIPFLLQGGTIYEDKLAEEALILREVCEEIGYGFINLAPIFVEFNKRTRRFPRGFPNSNPFEGHLNREGHKLLADEIYRHLSEKF